MPYSVRNIDRECSINATLVSATVFFLQPVRAGFPEKLQVKDLPIPPRA
jgi:hypothetical protein